MRSRPGCSASPSRKKSSSALRRYDFPLVVPALPGAAADRAADPAVVRRQRRGVDHLHAVLPGAAARGIRLRAPPDQILAPQVRAADPQRAARGRPGDAADRAARRVEAARQRGAGEPDPAAARGERRVALLPARGEQPAAAGVVLARAAAREPLPPVRGLEPRLAGGAARLPLPARAQPGRRRAGEPVVVAVRRLRGPMRGGCLADAGGGGRTPGRPRKYLPARTLTYCGSRSRRRARCCCSR